MTTTSAPRPEFRQIKVIVDPAEPMIVEIYPDSPEFLNMPLYQIRRILRNRYPNCPVEVVPA